MERIGTLDALVDATPGIDQDGETRARTRQSLLASPIVEACCEGVVSIRAATVFMAPRKCHTGLPLARVASFLEQPNGFLVILGALPLLEACEAILALASPI